MSIRIRSYSPRMPLSGRGFFTVMGFNFGSSGASDEPPSVLVGDRICETTSELGVYPGLGGSLLCELGTAGKP